MFLSQLGELEFINKIRVMCSETLSGPTVGIGDDCAVFPLDGEEATHLGLLTTDLLIEGVHFSSETSSMWELGMKAIDVNVSDIAAMGGIPVNCTVAMAVDSERELIDVMGLYRGLVDAARAHQLTIIGGDTSRSPGPLFLSITVFGKVGRDELLRRNAARIGDLIVVSGDLGGSHTGLTWLQADLPMPMDDTISEEIVAAVKSVTLRHALPQARVRLGRCLAGSGICHACIDISDGLATDLGHICRESSVGASVDLETIPIASATKKIASLLAIDPLYAAVSGGEDYELLFTVAADAAGKLDEISRTADIPLTVIGRIQEGEATIAWRENGCPCDVSFSGYEHFRQQD